MKRVILSFEHFYNIVEIQAAAVSHQEMVEVELSDEDYTALLPDIGDHYLAENDGDDVKIINCNL